MAGERPAAGEVHLRVFVPRALRDAERFASLIVARTREARAELQALSREQARAEASAARDLLQHQQLTGRLEARAGAAFGRDPASNVGASARSGFRELRSTFGDLSAALSGGTVGGVKSLALTGALGQAGLVAVVVAQVVEQVMRGIDARFEALQRTRTEEVLERQRAEALRIAPLVDQQVRRIAYLQAAADRDRLGAGLLTVDSPDVLVGRLP